MADLRTLFGHIAIIEATAGMARERRNRGLSIRGLHDRTGISESSLRQIEKGDRWPNDSERERLTAALGRDFFRLPKADAKGAT